jgi:hypothetical protein
MKVLVNMMDTAIEAARVNPAFRQMRFQARGGSLALALIGVLSCIPVANTMGGP